VSPQNWHDNVGQVETADRIPDPYAGSGCTNCCWTPGEPSIKVHVVDTAAGARFFVRVWEAGAL
jgi:hypothetical protein